MIVSGKRLACFEPQEKIWKEESGIAFDLPTLISQSSDFVAPLNGLASFDSNTVRHSGYSHTIFRLPLRTVASGLSNNVYNIRKLTELLDALREEAKYLLLFLKSVCKIEVVHIPQRGQLSTSFCVEIANARAVSDKRDSFGQQLKLAHQRQPYKINRTISFTANFSIVVSDKNSRRNQSGTSTWVVGNWVGSSNTSVLAAAAEQHTFPWVGTALELGENSLGGRIFCFLPMPVESFSGLPIHVNGTFGLNDERRTLKWPGIERRNDPTANWNKILVSQLLPSCYAMLLTEVKKLVSPEHFYKAWPDSKLIKSTQFSEILEPLFSSLFKQAVFRTEEIEDVQQSGKWIQASEASFIGEGINLSLILKRVLINCKIQLVSVPSVVWQAIQLVGVAVCEVSPAFFRSKMRSFPGSYSGLDQFQKREVLAYCVLDNRYDDLRGLCLLPLASGKFVMFDSVRDQAKYLCSDNCPLSLLPNLDHILVDLSDDITLQKRLHQVAASQQTRLRVLTEKDVVRLLPQAMPSEWKSCSVVSMPHSQLTSTWLQTFWKWLKNKNLKLFNNQLLIPCYSSTSHSFKEFCLSRLNIAQPLIYVESNTSCSNSLLSALYKTNVRVCLQSEFSFVQHKQLTECSHQFTPNSVLDLIASQPSYKDITFSTKEAESLRVFFVSKNYTPSSTRETVLRHLPIFTSVLNSQCQLYSINSAASQSLAKQALGEPSKCTINISNLPPKLIILSRENYHQFQLLQALQLTFPSDYKLLVVHVLPLIRNKTFPDHLIDNLMSEVLDLFQVLNSRESNSNLSDYLKCLPFVKTLNGRKSPTELFDPLNANIAALYDGEDVFPEAPYNTRQRIQVLIYCGLCATVSPQHVIDIICSISSSATSNPQKVDNAKMNRARAVLDYISSPRFHIPHRECCSLPGTKTKSSFPDALKQLAISRSWLPVLSDRPSDYCDKLPWKGSDCSSHLVCLSNSVVLSSTTAHTLPHLVGSQMYIVSPTVPPKVAVMLPSDSAIVAKHVVAHFKQILACKEELSVEVLDSLVHKVYHYMNGEGVLCLQQFYSIKEWIYLKTENRFVAPALVALRRNPSFKIDLEPYLYILPDTLTQHTYLFKDISPAISQPQILSVLKVIRDDVQAGIQRVSCQEAWGTIMSILNWLTEDGTKSVSNNIASADILVPIEAESEWPQLVQASEVVYTDNEFLKEYIQSLHEKDSHKFVHRRISVRLAHHLGVVPLSEYLDISEDVFEDTGQHEPLTTRLKNILRDYKDGLTIFKELLQNADDAEATEVNICYDARQHETDPKKLFFSGMTEAHGPALIVHNNKTFSDDDFKNITKLAGATKKDRVFKIGKFGVGFCAVYHMTDVPSFITRDYMYIFDPTLSYLKKEVKNPARPGKKTKFACKFLSDSRQLDPYDGLFGFDRAKSFQGTMFRFPFRTHASELSGTCYTESTVQELISAIKENSANLLIFLQNVRVITFQQIQEGQITSEVIWKISRDTVPLPLQVSKSSIIKVRNIVIQSKSCQWLVAQNSETNSQKEYYTASVACPLGSSNCYKVDANFEGGIFCFLPLSQKTGLPVHISSNFAVINNRRGIWTSDEATSQTEKEVTWNISLMEGVIAKAYHALLMALKEMSSLNLLSDYTFYDLWPKEDKLMQHNPWAYMLPQLYQLIASDQLFYSTCRKQWLHIEESQFLTSGILCRDSAHSSTPQCVYNVLQSLRFPIVDLPVSYHSYFKLKTIDESAFARIFFENLDVLKSNLRSRSEVIQYMLEVYVSECDDATDRSSVLKEYLAEYACTPCTPNGRILRKCTEVIDPRSSFAQLFDLCEGHCPIEQLSERELSYTALKKLGMISETIPYNVLVECAQSISSLYKTDRIKALKRVELILLSCPKIEGWELLLTNKGKVTQTKKEEGQVMTSLVELSSIPFLPVLPRPLGYHLAWKGDGRELMCGKELMIEGADTYGKYVNPELAGSQAVFVNQKSTDEWGCGPISQDTLDFLEIRSSPSVEGVVAHLTELQQAFQSQPATTDVIVSTNKMCRQVYSFLDRNLTPETDSSQPDSQIMKSLEQISCLWTGKQFVELEILAQESWSIDGPYLYCLPPILSTNKNLVEALKIKEHFSFEDVVNALSKMKKDFGDLPIDERCQNMLKDIISLLQKLKLNASDISTLMLPDEHYILRPSNRLTYNDVHWAPKDTKYTYIHDIVPPHLAQILKVVPARSKILEKFVSPSTQFESVEFGPHEELTTRIQNILQDYPFDVTILKELLQNADDARAKKVYFILDKRTHGSQGVLSKNWEKLQGPALLVWNNSVFSKKDLEGIQKLGLGSKRNDAETIGHYGIGFNVVYHLTDCPSFITGGETLCVLDPHCEYMPEASKLYPGRRFDGLKKGFWESFPDMSSSYLQSGLDNCPPEIRGGSLFRFPLRTSYFLEHSRIVQRDKDGRPMNEALTSKNMFEMLQEWIPRLKEALLFLDHVTELQFMVIERSSKKLRVIEKLLTKIGDSDLNSCARFRRTLPRFRKMQGNKSDSVKYFLTVSKTCFDSAGKTTESIDENWLIQQGVGDADNEQQTWSFIDTVKPRHGIAVPIPSPDSLYHRILAGKIFCFLPLPLSTNLPVHINGNFILNSSRRSLWTSLETGREDDRTTWNSRLFQALASSYANLLEDTRSIFVSQKPYRDFSTAENHMNQYYQLFPHTAGLEDQYRVFVKSVYLKLVRRKSKILAVVSRINTSTQASFIVNWHPPSKGASLDQVYFRNYLFGFNAILEGIGMKITAARSVLQHYLNDAMFEDGGEVKCADRNAIYNCYCEFYAQAKYRDKFPLELSKSIFRTVSIFRQFSRQLLKNSDSKSEKVLVFPKEPYGHPLLLTADGLLRRFDRKAKVLKSHSLYLFPECLEHFLHPSVVDLSYSEEYFATHPYSLTLIEKVFSKHFPRCLMQTRVDKFPPKLTTDRLVGYWKCFASEQVFRENLPELLKDWALLPSIFGSLHSCSDTLVPIVPIDKESSSIEAEVYHTLQRVKVPVLDTKIVAVSIAQHLSCPTVSDIKAILKVIFHFHLETDLSTVMNGKRVMTLIDYFKKVDLRYDQDNLTRIKSLPLFECIDGTFTEIEGNRTYIWPDDACHVGYSKWIKHHPNVVFLNRSSKWNELVSMESLRINSLSAEELYCEYIFKFFNSLSEPERYKHLTHIKNVLFLKNHSKQNKGVPDAESRCFLDELKTVPCISDSEVLKPVSYYYDHNLKILTYFSKSFPFLPDFFRRSWDEWLEFLDKLGLQRSVTMLDYLEFCNEIVNHEKAIEEPIRALFDYLLSDTAKKAGWHENSHFLEQLADVSFVPTQTVSELTWLVDAPHGSEQKLVKLKEAAILSTATHLWTVRPIVNLPLVLPEHRQLADRLGVICEASVSDTVQNIRNICASKKVNFTDFSHFDHYPDIKQPPGTKPIMAIMIDNFSLLLTKVKELGDSAKVLNSTPCIPVYATYNSTHSRQIVLVKPSTVLVKDVEEEFHPYLHKLDNELEQFFPLLKEIGVETTIGFSHIQQLLEMVYHSSNNQELNQITKCSVFAALRKLNTLLSDVSSEADLSGVAETLSPLYLPDCDDKLILSTSLLYVDDSSFRGTFHPQLKGTNYSLLKVKSKLKISEKDFCDALPPKVRPIGLSTKCSQTVSAQCEIVPTASIENTLKETFSIPFLPRALASCIAYYHRRSDLSSEFESIISEFLTSIAVTTFKCLRVDITFNETKQNFGSIDKLFCFKMDEEAQRHLYLDSSLERVSHRFSKLAESLSFYLLQLIQTRMKLPQVISREDRFLLLKLLGLLLATQNQTNIREILEDHDIPIEEDIYDATFELGKEIPECWHHRLDQVVKNVFHPGEIVGHEIMDNRIVYAMILHPVLPDGVEKFSEISFVRMKYVILTHQNDEEGMEVSIVTLYKFLRGKDSTVAEGKLSIKEAMLSWLGLNVQTRNIQEICSDLELQLDEVWKLPEEQKKKAIKRLCLRWHPDQNHGAKDVFEFLGSKISERIGIEEIQWEDLARTARQQRESYEREWSFLRAESRGKVSGRSAGASAGTPVFDEERICPKRDEDEGKRWLKQARANCRTLRVLSLGLQNNPMICGDVCFMAHQVAEKALKGGKFFVCGLDENSLHSHKITTHAYGLQSERPEQTHGLVAHTKPLENYYLNPRYPNYWPVGITPVDQYDCKQAEAASTHAQQVLTIIQRIVK